MSEDLIEIVFTAPAYDSVHVPAREVLVPGEGGIFTVRAGHTALLSTLAPGVIHVFTDQDEERYFAVSGGFAEVRDNKVTILAEAFEPGNEVDLKRAEAARARAEERLLKPDETTDLLRAESALARAMARVEAHGGEGY